jgi:hypothetical protein
VITVAVVTRRLKEGKTYEDFRRAWYHTVGFGTSSRLYTLINADDPREIIVIGFVETELDRYLAGLEIDVKERLANLLDEVIEPAIGRKFGILVAEDDFSAEGAIAYKPPSVRGKETDLKEVSHELAEISRMIAQASAGRDRMKKGSAV